MFSAAPVDAVRNPHAQGQQLAHRLSGLQALAAIVTALPWLLRGPREALAALVGGLVVALGTWLLGRGMFGGAGVSAASAFTGLIVGSLARWMTIAIGVVLAIGWAGLPPSAVCSGLIVALMVQLFGMRLQTKSAPGKTGN